MTSTQTVDARFGLITAMGGPNPSPVVAIAGPYHRILMAEKVGEKLTFLGESEDLGAEVLAVNNESSPNFHVLTAAGALRVSDADEPQIVTESEFDPGGGRWLHLFGGSFLATPLANGGIQVLNAATLVQIGQMRAVSDSRFAACLATRGYLWVVDGRKAQIGTFKVNTSTGTLTYIGKTAAPNCRDVLKVVLDSANGNLFVVCRRRIVRFVVPLAVVDEPLPVFTQDYGVATADYTDLVVLDENQYWIAQDFITSPTVLDAFYGPQYGVWDPSLGAAGELVVAAPKGAIWTVNDLVPYYTEDTIDETVDPPVPPVVDPPTPPPVILPPAPVITSSLTASATEDTLFSYTITATGSGPITYGVTSPPAWLTSINPLTGVISGTPPDAATVNITVTATNAGGTDSETLVVTVAPSIADLGLVAVNNGAVNALFRSGSLVYVGGTFTSVSDANGTYTRNRVACLNFSTGLWTSWDPDSSGTVDAIAVFDGYVAIGGASGTTGGVVHTGLVRAHPTTGVVDPTFVPALDAQVRALLASDKLYVGGSFQTIDASARVNLAAFDAGYTLSSWRPYQAGNFITAGGSIYALADAGSEVLWCGDGTVRIAVSSIPVVYSFGRSLKSDALTATYTWGGYSSFAGRCCHADGSRDYVGGSFVGVDRIADSAVFTSRTNLAAIDSKTTVASFAPNPAAVPRAIYANPDTGNMFVGFNAGKLLQYTAAGAAATSPTWTGGAGTTVLAVTRVEDALVFGGDFAGATINGEVRTRLVFMNINTGVVY